MNGTLGFKERDALSIGGAAPSVRRKALGPCRTDIPAVVAGTHRVTRLTAESR